MNEGCSHRTVITDGIQTRAQKTIIKAQGDAKSHCAEKGSRMRLHTRGALTGNGSLMLAASRHVKSPPFVYGPNYIIAQGNVNTVYKADTIVELY